MSGFENDVMVAKNINFDDEGPKPHLGIINAAGKFPIGTGASSPTPEILGGTITSPTGTLTIGYSSPNITAEARDASTSQSGIVTLAAQAQHQYNTYGTTQVLQSQYITSMMAKPAPIGSTTPNTGAFTSLSSNAGQTFSASANTFPVTTTTATSTGYSATNTVLQLQMAGSVPASILTGFGTSLSLYAQNTSGTQIPIGIISGVLDNVTAGTELAHISLAVNNNALTTVESLSIYRTQLLQSVAVSGASLSMVTTNTSNTASATAYHECIVAGGTASDAFFRSTISGGQSWSWGLDNSDSDAYVLSASNTPGTTNVMRVATTGEINYPLQSAFLAYLGTTDSNVTGDGTTFQLGSGNALTIVFDQNSDFNTNGTFTAPVTGRYRFDICVLTQQSTAGMSAALSLTTSNRTYVFGDYASIPGGNYPLVGSVLADMDAADTATVSITLGGGAKVVDIFGGAQVRTFFSGNLVC